MSERTPEYNVFISWSGDVSKRIALVVQDWLSTTVQASSPFVSDKDIDAGDRGIEEIGNQLDRIKTGIICLTNQNQANPWINFEAGNLSKRFADKAYVMCLLFDLEPGQVRFPLATFQNGPINEEYMARVARTVNKGLGNPLTEAKLASMFKLTWPILAQAMEKIRGWNSQQVMGAVEPVRTPQDMFEEIVVAIREQSTILAEIKKARSRPTLVDEHISLTVDVLRRLTERWGYSRQMSIQDVVDLGWNLDADDWRIIKTAPFLTWYLENYFNVYPLKARPEPEQTGDMDDVPF